MAKEKKENELETNIKHDQSIDVAVELKDKKKVSKTTKTISFYNVIEEFENEQLKKELPEIYVGDTVKVGVRITEGNKERIQPYEGVVLQKGMEVLTRLLQLEEFFRV